MEEMYDSSLLRVANAAVKKIGRGEVPDVEDSKPRKPRALGVLSKAE